MNLIQFYLVGSIVLFLCIYFWKFRSKLVDRLLVIIFSVFAIFLILMPELSEIVADFFGVGRGVDLAFYLAHSATGFFLLFLYLKSRHQMKLITELARMISIETAKAPMDQKKSQKEKILHK